MVFPSVSAPFIFVVVVVPVFPLVRKNSELKILRCMGRPHTFTTSHIYLLEVDSSSSISPLLGVLANVMKSQTSEDISQVKH